MDFWQTLLISAVPALLTGIISYLAAAKKANIEIKSIQEQNKADIEKLIEQNKVNIKELQEKYKLESDLKEKEYAHQIELLKIQNQGEMKKEEESVKTKWQHNC